MADRTEIDRLKAEHTRALALKDVEIAALHPEENQGLRDRIDAMTNEISTLRRRVRELEEAAKTG